MKLHPAYLYSITYRMERRDYVALSRTLTQRPLGRVLLEILLYVGALLLLVAIAAGRPEAFGPLLLELLTSATLMPYLPVLLLGPVLLLLGPWIMGLIAALIYKRNAFAGKEVSLHLTADGIEGGVTDLYSRIGWAAVTRLVETPTHIFIQISPREALIVPRRAVPSEELYNNIKGFIRARTGLSTYA